MKKNKYLETMSSFARTLYQLLKSDRDVVIGVGGFTGEGKTTFTIHLERQYSRISRTFWNFDRITWSRKELMIWIDGKSDKVINGLKEGQLPEYSAILPDELFYMFYKRTWFEQEQIQSIATFNMCRDRHLLVAGNVPDFWDLDPGFLKRIRFYVYIPERGRAWVFQQENNPFTKDPWNVNENKKLFRKMKNPYRISNFVCEIHFDDLNPEDKREYYAIRKVKRVKAIKEDRGRKERYSDIKDQRDNAIVGWISDRKTLAKRFKKLCTKDKKILKSYKATPTNNVIADVIGISHEAVRLIRTGQR